MQDLETKEANEAKSGSSAERLTTNSNNGIKTSGNNSTPKSTPIKCSKADESDVKRKYLSHLSKGLRKNWSAEITADGRIFYLK